jgi:hypothetical protein
VQTIKLTKDIPHEGLSKGDVINVDELSAKSLIDRKDAEEYTPPKASDKPKGERARYGGQEAETIDDIVDPEARGARIMTVRVVGEADKGDTSRKRGKPAARGASGAKPAGGDAGGSDTG